MGHAAGVSVRRVVSGGQTGADRAALDAARHVGLPYGGWCPRGGRAEDLPRPPGLLAAYPGLRECPSAAEETRTERNVRDSDATLVVSLRDPSRSSGTTLTRQVAERLGRPLLVAQAHDTTAMTQWLIGLDDGLTLNIAGPRESEEPGLYAAAFPVLCEVLRKHAD